MISVKRADIVEKLQTEILRLQGFKPSTGIHANLGLGPILEAFPNGCFPLGAVHEFLSPRPEDMAATTGFIMGLLSPLMNNGGASVWVGSTCTVFPPGLRHFGVQPDRVIFLDLHNEKDILWALEEALKCGALSAVVGEMSNLSFTNSRRLQLAVEQSKVSGFVVRTNSTKVSTTACVSRWKITPLPGIHVDELPGIGYPQWRVELLRVRNGRPGVWNVSWMNGAFHPVLHSNHKAMSGDASFSNKPFACPSEISSGKHRKAG